jgi:chromosome transmission fidelity protein 1
MASNNTEAPSDGVVSEVAAAPAPTTDFRFPFTPYPQQLHLMQSIHGALASGKVGIFESPTGTGKSLSIICGALTWLFGEEKRILKELEDSITFEPEPDITTSLEDWLGIACKDESRAQNALSEKRDAYYSYLEWIAQVRASRSRNERTPPRKSNFRPNKSLGSPSPISSSRLSRFALSNVQLDEEDLEHIMEDYDSDSAVSSARPNKHRSSGRDKEASRSAETGISDDDEDDMSFMESLQMPQIIYCSRTHSQLSQFVAEIQKTSFAAYCRCIVLASRKALCINSEVTKLKDDAAISETCLEKQRKGVAAQSSSASGPAEAAKKPRKSSSIATTKCPYRRRDLDETYAETSLNAVRDLEDLVGLGHRLEACPYYGGRRAARYAHVICVPYNMLVNKELRSSLGVRLRGNVVIMDEAHNISEAVCDAHSASLSARDLHAASTGIAAYVDRYGSVLGGKSLVYIDLLRTVVRELREFLLRHAMSVRTEERQSVLTPNEFLFRTRLDNINFLKLKRFLKTTKIVVKIGGFVTGQRRRAAAQRGDSGGESVPGSSSSGKSSSSSSNSGSGKTSTSLSPCGDCGASETQLPEDCTGSLRRIINFVSCLTNPEDQGKVVVSLGAPDDAESVESPSPSSRRRPLGRSMAELENASLQFIAMDAASPFRDVVASARSVLLLGGTMRPFSHVIRSLLSCVPTERIITASFGHIIDPDRVLPMTLGKGVMGTELSFNYARKKSLDMLIDVGETLLRIAQAVPRGMVCFFTSYDYMEQALELWRKVGQPTSIHARIDAVKRIFIESRRRSAEVGPDAWEQFRHTVMEPSQGAAVLFCVINGKLSEGINFSDNLARCVVIVGMPYPNPNSCVLKEKLDFAQTAQQICKDDVYQLMCMKAVNQSIGRSIRHARDYASIVLMDSRYRDRANVAAMLPQWIASSLAHPSSADQLVQSLETFFARHRDKDEDGAATTAPRK